MTATRHIEVDPTAYFADWHYVIRPALFGALGVTRREYADPAKTRAARVVAEARGLPQADVARIRITRLAYAVAPTPILDFHPGDVFHSDHSPQLQVMASQRLLEIHLITRGACPRSAYHLTAEQLAAWLRTGPPAQAPTLRIGPWESHCPVLFDAIEPPPRGQLP